MLPAVAISTVAKGSNITSNQTPSLPLTLNFQVDLKGKSDKKQHNVEKYDPKLQII